MKLYNCSFSVVALVLICLLLVSMVGCDNIKTKDSVPSTASDENVTDETNIELDAVVNESTTYDALNANNQSNDDRVTEVIDLSIREKTTVRGVIELNDTSFPTYRFRLDSKILVKDYGDKLMECEYLYFYTAEQVEREYDFSEIVDKECLISAYLEHYRGGGSIYLNDPTVLVDGVEVDIFEEERNESNETLEINERYLGRWEDLYIGEGMKFDDYTWNVEFRSDGTGTFEFVYGTNDIEYLNFTFSTFLPRENGMAEGVLICDEFGKELLRVYVTCTWSNELQTSVMSLIDWENIDYYWSFRKVM